MVNAFPRFASSIMKLWAKEGKGEGSRPEAGPPMRPTSDPRMGFPSLGGPEGLKLRRPLTCLNPGWKDVLGLGLFPCITQSEGFVYRTKLVWNCSHLRPSASNKAITPPPHPPRASLSGSVHCTYLTHCNQRLSAFDIPESRIAKTSEPTLLKSASRSPNLLVWAVGLSL